jgi:RimJ/RimL family protein N-acetyltransferase
MSGSGVPTPLPRLSTGDVRLREVTEGDLPILFEHQRDPVANRIAAFPARDRDAFMTHWHGILSDEALICRTVVVGDQVAGNVVCFERYGVREVGYWIAREHWGRGVATLALSELLGLVDARPLYGRVAKDNVASIRVLEKCGFRESDEDIGPTEAPDDGVEEALFKLDAQDMAGPS